MKQHPDELDVLCSDLLIGVSSFFRDPGAFRALRRVLLRYIAARSDRHVVRAWIAGCSTGQEAYSIAMLLRECAAAVHASIDVQLFATDLHPHAIDVARAGLYSAGIADDMPAERLARFFCRDGASFRVCGEIRDAVVFTQHDLFSDPPFANLDLVSCRNVLIYYDSPGQSRAFPVFHRALVPGGTLFLGASETTRQSALFARASTAQIYSRRDEAAARPARRPASVEASPIAHLTIHDDGTIVESNDAAATMLGRPADAIRQRQLVAFVGASYTSALRALLASVMVDGGRRNLEIELLTADGRSRAVRIHVAAMTRRGRRVCCCAMFAVVGRRNLTCAAERR